MSVVPGRVARAPGGVAPIPALAGIGCEITAGILWLVADTAHPRIESVVVWSSLSFTAFAAGLLLLVGAGHRSGLGLPQFKLGTWSLLWCVVAFGLASLAWKDPQVGSASEIDISFVPSALALTAAGLLAWVVGYVAGPVAPLVQLGRRGMAALARARTPVVRSAATPWLLYAIGLTGQVAPVFTRGQLGYVGDASGAVSSATGYDQIINTLGLFTQFAVAAAAIRVFCEGRRGTARSTLVILIIFEIALSGISGEKQSFITTGLAVLIPMAAARRRLPLLPLFLAVLAFVCLIIPFNQAYRSEARSGRTVLTASQAVAEAPAVLGEVISADAVIRAVPDAAVYLATRLRNIDGMTIILQRSPESIPFLDPLELLAAPILGLVPRAVWPDKPILATGYQFAQVYYQLPSSVYTSAAVTPTGDLYRHGGLVVLLVGMLLLGMGVRVVDLVLDVRRTPHAVLFVLLLFPPLVKYESDYLTLVAGIPVTVLAASVGVLLTFRTRKAP